MDEPKVELLKPIILKKAKCTLGLRKGIPSCIAGVNVYLSVINKLSEVQNLRFCNHEQYRVHDNNGFVREEPMLLILRPLLFRNGKPIFIHSSFR